MIYCVAILVNSFIKAISISTVNLTVLTTAFLNSSLCVMHRMSRHFLMPLLVGGVYGLLVVVLLVSLYFILRHCSRRRRDMSSAGTNYTQTLLGQSCPLWFLFLYLFKQNVIGTRWKRFSSYLSSPEKSFLASLIEF